MTKTNTKIKTTHTHEEVKKQRQRAKFTIPDKDEIMRDRDVMITQSTVEIVKDGDNMSNIRHLLEISESIINFRLSQLGLNKAWTQTDKPNIQELFEGAPKPESILKAELAMNVYDYKREVLAFEKLKDKFLKQHKFEEDDVLSIMAGDYDWTNWSKEFKEKQLNETSKAIDNVDKPKTD